MICGGGGHDIVHAGGGNDVVVMHPGQTMVAFLEDGDDSSDGAFGRLRGGRWRSG